MRTQTKILLVLMIVLYLSPLAMALQNRIIGDLRFEENPTVEQLDHSPISRQAQIEQPLTEPAQGHGVEAVDGGSYALQVSSLYESGLFTRHLMCKGHDLYYDPVSPTPIFKPSDEKAECLTTVTINNSIDFKWYYRNDSTKAWISCYNWTSQAYFAGEYHYAGYLLITGYWPGIYFPKAYKVDVYLDGAYSFSDFFEITNGGLNSPRICEDVDAAGYPINAKSLFTVGEDAKAQYSLRLDKLAYFNDQFGFCHNFTTVWIQPDASVYKMHSGIFNDYKNENISWNCWNYAYDPNDYVSIDSGTPVGNWKVEVYIDTYLNNTWIPYGPVASTPFVIANESVADWTLMAYLDGDSTLEIPSIDVFLNLANVDSSPQVNVVVQMDRASGLPRSPIDYEDERYGNWTDCKRFNVTKGMTPTPENAAVDLGEVNMGEPETLRDFLNWTINNFPADRYFLAIFDHGTGFAGLCFDFENGNHGLSLPELSQAFDNLTAIIDVVLLDACSMSMVEVAYQLRNCTNVLIGPQGVGYAPAPYNAYLSSLTNNSHILPVDFAREVVIQYMAWCTAYKDTATMSAIDLTKTTTLAAAIDAFSARLKEKETLQHELISLALNTTEGQEGPLANDIGYYIDLYHFAQQINQSVPDEQLCSAADELMASLSVGNTIVIEEGKNKPNSHGLSTFFPNETQKLSNYSSLYKRIDFSTDTLWDELVEYHLTGFLLTVQTIYPDIPAEVDDDSYSTEVNGRFEVFLPNGSHRINLTTMLVQTTPDSRGIFVNWSDGVTSNPRDFSSKEGADLTLRAIYETQYRLMISTNFGSTLPPVGEYWCNASSEVSIKAIAPDVASEEKYTFDRGWFGTGPGSYTGTENPHNMTIAGPVNETAVWQHQYLVTIFSADGSQITTKNYTEVGTTLNLSVNSPLPPDYSDVRKACVGWNGTGSAPASGTSLTVTFVLNEPSSLTWNWQTQYLLDVLTEPAGLGPQPTISPPGDWHESGANVTLLAQHVNDYDFDHWTVDGVNWDVGVNAINITFNEPHEAIAHYIHARAWWETLFRPDVAQVVLGLVGTMFTVALIGTAWVRSRKRRNVVKTFLDEISDVFSRFRTDPPRCEEELSRLRNTILEGFTGGRISEDNYNVLDKKIDECVKELQRQRDRETKRS